MKDKIFHKMMIRKCSLKFRIPKIFFRKKFDPRSSSGSQKALVEKNLIPSEAYNCYQSI